MSVLAILVDLDGNEHRRFMLKRACQSVRVPYRPERPIWNANDGKVELELQAIDCYLVGGVMPHWERTIGADDRAADVALYLWPVNSLRSDDRPR